MEKINKMLVKKLEALSDEEFDRMCTLLMKIGGNSEQVALLEKVKESREIRGELLSYGGKKIH